jgi:peptidoglycan hydrolase CwlO-like protein
MAVESILQLKQIKVKKLTISIFASMMMFTVIPSQVEATVRPINTTITATEPEETEVVKALNNRLNEINQMDMSALSRSEKKELRNEVRAIKSELKVQNGGIYLSVGAIIIIVLLLILLL